MNVTKLFAQIDMNDIDIDFTKDILLKKNELSSTEKRFLLNEISKFKTKDIDNTIKAIKLYAIWYPGESISEARKKGVFRYRAHGFQENKALHIINELLSTRQFFDDSESSIKYLSAKKSVSWFYDIYKDTENKLISKIKHHHSIRKKTIRGD